MLGEVELSSVNLPLRYFDLWSARVGVAFAGKFSKVSLQNRRLEFLATLNFSFICFEILWGFFFVNDIGGVFQKSFSNSFVILKDS